MIRIKRGLKYEAELTQIEKSFLQEGEGRYGHARWPENRGSIPDPVSKGR